MNPEDVPPRWKGIAETQIEERRRREEDERMAATAGIVRALAALILLFGCGLAACYEFTHETWWWAVLWLLLALRFGWMGAYENWYD